MQLEIEERLQRLFGPERAFQILLSAAQRAGLAWPPRSPDQVMQVLVELERSMPGAVAVTARGVRRNVRTSRSMLAIASEGEAYKRTRRALSLRTDAPEALTRFQAELARRGLGPSTLQLDEARDVLDRLGREDGLAATRSAFLAVRQLLA